ncbi:MAG: hypothetical protein ACJASZ_002448, partial [Yoonia sp.]
MPVGPAKWIAGTRTSVDPQMRLATLEEIVM